MRVPDIRSKKVHVSVLAEATAQQAQAGPNENVGS
jgi:hypothetical protein